MKRLLAPALTLASVVVSAADLGVFLAVGDSMTLGAGGSPGTGGWRRGVVERLRSVGFTLTPAGSLQTWPSGSWPEGAHDGHGGWTTQDVIDGKNGEGSIVDWLVAYQPDTIVLTIGRNDPWDWSYSYDKYTRLANIIYTLRPNVRVYWCSVALPRDQGYWEDYHCQTQNTAVRQVVSEQHSIGRKIWYVDDYTALKGLDYIFSDSVHFNDVGYALWGDVIFDSIRKTASSIGGPIRKSPSGVQPWR